MKLKMNKIKKIAFALILAFGLIGCSDTEDSDLRTYKIGLNGTDHQVWDLVNEKLEEYGIKLEYVEFSDYVKPNEALEEGEIDLNSFQTVIYFENFCQERGYTDLSILAYTSVAPMGIYSNKYDDIEDLPTDSKLTIAIPNDATNGGRAILFLESLGYITVDDDAGLTPTVNDITGFELNLEIVEMTATQIPRSLDDVDFAVINNGVAYEAGLTIKDDALVYEDYQADGMENYWNVIVCKNDQVEAEDFQKIKEVYNSDEIKEKILEVYGGQTIPVWD